MNVVNKDTKVNYLSRNTKRELEIARITRVLNTLDPTYCFANAVVELKHHFGADVDGSGLNIIRQWIAATPLTDEWTEKDVSQVLKGHKDSEFDLPDLETRWETTQYPEDLTSADVLIARLRRARATLGANYLVDWPTKRADSKAPDPRCQLNIRTTLDYLGVRLYKNEFDHRYYIEGFEDFHELDDEAMRALWLTVDELGLPVAKERFVEIVLDVARQSSRHPVREYLDNLPDWDGLPRLDSWLSDYAGAEDTPLTNQIGRKVLLAAVRRVRQPGVKFDTMLVLEGKQGAGKSSLVRVIAGEWFEDGLLLGSDPKIVIEQTSGKWIAEVSELGGMSKRDIENVKAMLSRTHDTARLAYGRASSTVPRQFIMMGTTNSPEFLKDETGNRRFLPVEVRAVNLDTLLRDRDQLWAEAAQAEALRNRDGSHAESLELPRELWDDAATVQDSKVVSNPTFELLERVLDGWAGRIAKETIREIVRGNQEADLLVANRMDSLINAAMTRLDWHPRKIGSDGTRERVWEKHYQEGEPKLRFNVGLGRLERELRIGERRQVDEKVVQITERRAALV
jgi:hypothetical protein